MNRGDTATFTKKASKVSPTPLLVRALVPNVAFPLKKPTCRTFPKDTTAAALHTSGLHPVVFSVQMK